MGEQSVAGRRAAALPPAGGAALWRLLEAYHAVVYYAPERPQYYNALGLKGGWMGYFASRSGALGAVPPPVVTACFYNFKPTMVARALPDAWTYTSPEQACRTRLEVFDAAIRRLMDDQIRLSNVGEAVGLATDAIAACDPAGRPLFAAHAALPVPEPPHLALFWAASALREFRGDGHCAALVHAEIDGCEAHVLMAALGLVPPDQRTFRGWDGEDWAAAIDRLSQRGLVDPSGAITAAGRAMREEIEMVTDRLAAAPCRRLGGAGVDRLTALLTPIVDRIVAGGGVPYPNGMGVRPAR